MKKKLLFIVSFAVYLGLLLYIDWLKGTRFAVYMHGDWIRIKTAVMVLGGIALVYAFLGRRSGHLFTVLYLLLWALYGGMQLVISQLAVGSNWRYRWEEVREIFLLGSQLLTPLPIMVYWLAITFFKSPQPGEQRV